MITAGIDAGSRTVKVVLLDTESLEVVGSEVADQSVDQDALARRLFHEVLHGSRLDRADVRAVVATGYGRKMISAADATITEITCQAWGVRHRVPQARTIIDIGGQDSKVLRLAPGGAVEDFAMNDRCAAGTGHFLEVLATRLGVKLTQLGELAGKVQEPASISSMCVVFAETEVIGLLASGISPESIVAGVQASIARRVVAMAGHRAASPIVFTGGVAMVPGMDVALQSALRRPVTIAPDPQRTGALGAAILASHRLNGRKTSQT
ncbi:MAG: hypothetical protein A2V70_02220 [Planctomycetes bacterium RBG_13_63_9]|nr:MAG: hypothetical protein A2V70_02220 [Planctomycetes bacterium RBG_13_63_9]